MRTTPLAARSVLTAALLLACAAVWVGPAAPGASARAGSRPTSVSVPFPGQFNGVAATSAGNAWAVGYEPGLTLIQRWTGKAWKTVPTLTLGPPDGDFYGVAATSASNAWAVGYYPGETSSSGTLIAHWNGKTWKQVRSPNDGHSVLTGVAVTSARNAWAVGEAGTGSLIVHWNGKAWRRVPSPSPGPQGSALYAVAATSANNAWAVGNSDDESTFTTLILHWNGKVWRRVPSPRPAVAPVLYGVSATSATNAWAVGYTAVYAEGWKTLILHWNGKTWKQVPSPDPVAVSSSELTWNILQSVAATSAGNAWAVGYSEKSLQGSKTMILHWNGKTWKQVRSPNPFCATCDSLYGVTATSARSAWAVGTVNVGGEVIILRWNGSSWKNSQSAPLPG
jgi:hypothetical protein